MSKVIFLRLRNRTLNKFKAQKTKKVVKRSAKRVARPNKIKKTLRVIPKTAQKPNTGKASPQ